MFYLEASSISTSVKERIAGCSGGRVLNVFSHAMNIIDENEDVIGICKPEAMNNPVTILAPQINTSLPLCFPGMKVHFSTNSLSIDHSLLLSVEHASLFDPLVRLEAPLLPFSLIRERLRYISTFSIYGRGGVGELIPYYGLITEGILPEVKLGTWSTILAPRLVGLCKAFVTEDVEQVRRFFNQIIGTGVGLTPSGDDVLIGLFGSFVILLKKKAPGNYFDKILPDESWTKGTSPLSRALIRHSLRGELCERLGNFIRPLLTDEGLLEDALKQLVSFGASSGEDSILGVLLGINIGLQVLDSN